MSHPKPTQSWGIVILKFLEVSPEFSLFHCSSKFSALICLSKLKLNNLDFSKVPDQNKTKLYTEGQIFKHRTKFYLYLHVCRIRTSLKPLYRQKFWVIFFLPITWGSSVREFSVLKEKGLDWRLTAILILFFIKSSLK